MHGPRVPRWYAIKSTLDILNIQFCLAYNLQVNLIILFMVIVMLIRQGILMIVVVLVLIAYFMAKTSFRRATNSCS
jgi:high-affinity Fe2+/Pb2+ permease